LGPFVDKKKPQQNTKLFPMASRKEAAAAKMLRDGIAFTQLPDPPEPLKLNVHRTLDLAHVVLKSYRWKEHLESFPKLKRFARNTLPVLPIASGAGENGLAGGSFYVLRPNCYRNPLPCFSKDMETWFRMMVDPSAKAKAFRKIIASVLSSVMDAWHALDDPKEIDSVFGLQLELLDEWIEWSKIELPNWVLTDEPYVSWRHLMAKSAIVRFDWNYGRNRFEEVFGRNDQDQPAFLCTKDSAAVSKSWRSVVEELEGDKTARKPYRIEMNDYVYDLFYEGMRDRNIERMAAKQEAQAERRRQKKKSPRRKGSPKRGSSSPRTGGSKRTMLTKNST
jgi:hypothetical protein